MNSFWTYFKVKDFGRALETLNTLTSDEQQLIFEALYQKTGNHLKPHSVSVLFRKLHEGKTFEDFIEAWRPPAEYCHPNEVGGVLYQNFFPAPLRVINAINRENPQEIVSVSLNWLPEEKAESIIEASINCAANFERRDRIAEVADKTGTGIYVVQSDDNLGGPFS